MKAKDFRKKFLFGRGKKKEDSQEEKQDWEITTNNMELFGESNNEEKPLIDKTNFEKKIAENNYGDRNNMNTGAYVDLPSKIQEELDTTMETSNRTNVEEEACKKKDNNSIRAEENTRINRNVNPYVGDYIDYTKSVMEDIKEPVVEEIKAEQFATELPKQSKNDFINEADDEIKMNEEGEVKPMSAQVYNDYIESTDFKVENKPITEEVTSTTLVGSSLVKNAKPVNPSELGLPSDLRVQEVTFSFIDCVPLRVDKVEDTEGRLSAKLEQLEDKYSISVLPLDLCGIPDNVVSLKKHRILAIDGRKYADGTTRIVNHEAYSSLIGLARDCISRATEFKVNITKEQRAGQYSFKAPRLNSYELTKFISECKNYSPKVYTVSNGDIYIELGALRAKI